MERTLITLALSTSLVAVPAAAQQIDPGQVVPLGTWNQNVQTDLRGWSVRELDGSEVNGPDGDEIGDVEDLIIDPDGNVVSLIAEVGGFWDIGDHHVNVPWDQVELTVDEDDWFDTDIDVTIPLTEDNLDQFSLFGERDPISLASGMTANVDDMDAGERAWRTSELIGDYARLVGTEGPVNYGYVNDLMIRDGKVQATIINVGYPGPGGYYAYPNYATRGYGWTPGSPYYNLPYNPEEIEALDPISPEAY